MNIYFGSILKENRVKRNMTQDALANVFGVSFQTISKWERGEFYPDITAVPDIASYFGLTVDEMLGVNRAENEIKLSNLLSKYDNLTDKAQKWELINRIKREYPTDYRVLLRFMSYHIHYSDMHECKPVVTSIYENIVNNCTDDDVRMCAKRHIVQYYRNMSRDEDSGFSFDDVEKVLSTMPYMRDGKDFISCYVYPQNHPKHYEKCYEALEEILGLLDCIIEHCCLWEGDNYPEYNIEITKMMNKILDMFYDNESYGRQWRNVLRNYFHIGYFYSLKNDYENAVLNFKKAVQLAKKFDALDDVTVIDSKMLKGREFVKKELGSTYVASSSVKDWLLGDSFLLDDELRNKNEFIEIIELLEN